MMCGFVHESVYLTIDENKNVSFSAETLVCNRLEFDAYEYFSNISITSREYALENINQDSDYSGVKISKNFGSIDEVSNRMNSDAPISIEEYLLDGFDEKLLFSKDESFLNNLYKAEYKFSVYDLVRNIKKNIVDSSNDSLNVINDNIDSSVLASSENIEKLLDELESEFSFKFVVSLPNEVSDSNADRVSDDKKTLTWDITDINYIKNIKFSFELENKSNRLFVSVAMGIGVLVVIVIIILIIVSVKKHKVKKADSLPIHTDYDPSIEQLVKDENKLEIVEVDQTPEVALVANNVRSEETEIKLQEEQTILANEPIEKKRMFIDDNEFKEKLEIDENISKDEVYIEVPDMDDKL